MSSYLKSFLKITRLSSNKASNEAPAEPVIEDFRAPIYEKRNDSYIECDFR